MELWDRTEALQFKVYIIVGNKIIIFGKRVSNRKRLYWSPDVFGQVGPSLQTVRCSVRRDHCIDSSTVK